MKKNIGITLIALIITVIILIIIATVSINQILTQNGLLSLVDETTFKTRVSNIAEKLELYKSGLLMEGNSSKIYSGDLLKILIKYDEIKLNEKDIMPLETIIQEISVAEKEYLMVYEGNLYYVSRKEIPNNEKQIKWCRDLGIRIWDLQDIDVKLINGKYRLINGLYMCAPQLNIGFVKEKTRYLNLKDDNLEMGDWITTKPRDDWYDYKNQVWANIYVESDGIESYYVWIPRYVYKVDENLKQRMDIKFVDCENNYIDAETGEKLDWQQLQELKYKLPEAFTWDNNGDGEITANEQLSGYWMNKYQLSELTKYTVDFTTVATDRDIRVENVKINTSDSVFKYVYAVNGNILHESKTPEVYTIKNLAPGDKTINVTALNANGEIIGSMTKLYKVAKVNEPDISKFDPDTTFYVYWDENKNEHNEIPISKPAPANWYDYTTANWANIVTRNDGLETYFVWIPRYAYKLDTITQRTYVKFLEGTTSEVDHAYKIPEAFWWDNNGNNVMDAGEQLTGFWMSKYQLTTEGATPRIAAEMSSGGNIIRIKDITGTLISEAETNGVNIKFEYYLNGDKKHEGSNSRENYVYTNLNYNTTYTVNIIARNANTDEFIGAVTKKIKTFEPYAPNLDSFNKEKTFYVVYDSDWNETRIPITQKAPDNWYDYSNQKWANIVTTAENTETYFTWIPRYEYKILSDRTDLSTANRRIDVNFITTDITNSNCSKGYKVPEAFWWDNNGNETMDAGEQLTGYWMTKYQLSN